MSKWLKVVLTLACLAVVIGAYFSPVPIAVAPDGEDTPRGASACKVYMEAGCSKYIVASGGEIEVQSGATLDVQSGSTFGIGGVIGLANGTVAAPSLGFTSDAHTGLYRIGEHNLGLAAGGFLIADVTASSFKVEHGMTTDINGTLTVSETATFSGTVTAEGAITSRAGLVGTTVTASGLASLNAGIAVDTNVFTVADANGNTITRGTLGVWGNISNPKSANNDVQVADGMEAQAITATGSIKANAGVVVAHGQVADVNGTMTVSETAAFSGTMTVEGTITGRGLVTTGAISFTLTGAQNLTPAANTYKIDSGGGVTLTLQDIANVNSAVIVIVNTTANRVEIADTNIYTSDGALIHINQHDGVVLLYTNNIYYVLSTFTDS